MLKCIVHTLYCTILWFTRCCIFTGCLLISPSENENARKLAKEFHNKINKQLDSLHTENKPLLGYKLVSDISLNLKTCHFFHYFFPTFDLVVDWWCYPTPS